ncbi:MAG: hypothetical protein QM667_11165 [Asticcacaulis sp.]
MVDFNFGAQRNMTLPFNQVFRIIWPHNLGALPCIGGFIYLLSVVFPQRPVTPDPVRGFIHPMGIEGGDVFVSTLDLILLFGAWGLAAVFVVSGIWRVFRAAKKAQSTTAS